MKSAPKELHVMKNLLIVSIGAVMCLLNLSQVAVSDPSNKKGSASVCVGTGVYKPFNWWRQIQLSAAYYTNPQLRENAKVGTVYLAKYLSESKDPKIIEGLKGGLYSIMVPTPKFGKKTFSKIGSVKFLSDASKNDIKNRSEWLKKFGTIVSWHKGIPKEYKDNSYILFDAIKKMGQGKLTRKLENKGIKIVSWEPSKMVDLCNKLMSKASGKTK